MKSNKNTLLFLIGITILLFACSSCGGGRDVPSSMHPEPVQSSHW